MQSSSDAQTLARKVSFDPNYLPEFEAKMFIEGPQTARRLTNFFVLLLLATVIATFGVLSASTATVIGAMIVAPLMGPIMATAAAVVMGSSRRALRSLGLVAAGVAAVILLSVLLTLVVPNVTISFTKNGEIASRISPGLYAPLTALAAGAAGAFIMSRAEIADSMGGVAIAISLVPPLCVVGISVSLGEWGAAAGAMLLFLTNFLAILLAGGLVFVLAGLGRQAATEAHVRVRRRAFALIVAGTLLVATPLTITAHRALTDTLDDNKATAVVQEWLAGTPDQVVAVNVNDRLVVVNVEGPVEPPSTQDLANHLASALDRAVVVNLRVVPARLDVSSSTSIQTPGP
jgi:uncharacterized hydrophobic protein (TIGR00271 family)